MEIVRGPVIVDLGLPYSDIVLVNVADDVLDRGDVQKVGERRLRAEIADPARTNLAINDRISLLNTRPVADLSPSKRSATRNEADQD